MFIHPNPANAEPLQEFLTPLPERLHDYRLEHVVPVGLNVRTWSSCNWKIAIEAFLELYHLPAAHPQVMTTVRDTDPRSEEFENHNMMIIKMATPSPRLGPDFPADETPRHFFGAEDASPLEFDGDERDLERKKVEDSADRRSKGGVANGDYFMPAELSDPMAIFDQFRDETGEINLTNDELKTVLAAFFRKVHRFP